MLGIILTFLGFLLTQFSCSSMCFTFKALAGKVNVDKECVPNFALFEIMEYGFGKSNVVTCKTVMNLQ